MSRIAIFISGSGSNAENIIKHFSNNKQHEVVAVISDRTEAAGLQRAERLNIATYTFKRSEFLNGSAILDLLDDKKVDFIALAGFLCYVPSNIITSFKENILNIHPSLLPKHGGKGMYGERVHEAVIEAKDSESGITIHHINEVFDDGEIYFQAKCEVKTTDTAADVERKVRALEIEHFPKVIEQFLTNKQ